jgi:hypothetical protein
VHIFFITDIFANDKYNTRFVTLNIFIELHFGNCHLHNVLFEGLIMGTNAGDVLGSQHC